MSTAATHLLREFEKLSADEQREIAGFVARRAAQLDYDGPSDEELTGAAARMFVMLDQEEDDAAAR